MRSCIDRQKIILVEDDRSLRESLSIFLSRQGFDLVVTGSAKEFFCKISATAFAVAILDLTLPDEDGLVLARYLRENTTTRILMLTSRTSSEECLEGYRSGADIYMRKPVDFKVLAAALQSLLNRTERVTESLSGNSTPVWKLCTTTRELIAPDNTRIALTTKEFLVLRCLATEKSEMVERTRFLEALGYELNEYGHKRLETISYRIRRKTRQTEFFRRSPLHGVTLDLERRKDAAREVEL